MTAYTYEVFDADLRPIVSGETVADIATATIRVKQELNHQQQIGGRGYILAIDDTGKCKAVARVTLTIDGLTSRSMK